MSIEENPWVMIPFMTLAIATLMYIIPMYASRLLT